MKLCLKILAIATIATSTYSIIGCSAPTGFSYQNVAITFTAQCSDCNGQNSAGGVFYNPALPQPPLPGSAVLMPATGQGGTVLFTASVQNAPSTNITWNIYPTPNLTTPNPPPTGTTTPVGESGSSVGSFNTPSGSSTTAYGTTAYYSQGGVPVYSGAALVQAQAMGIPQGDVLLVATLPSDPNNPSAVATGTQLVQIYGGTTANGPPTVYLTPRTPTTPAGITSPAVTVSHNGGTFQFYGGVVGAAPCNTTASCAAIGPNTPLRTTDNAPIWEVGPSPFSLTTAVVGGNSTYGTITQTGLYTAPPTVPAVQPVVVLVSHLAPTVSAYAYVGVN